MAKASTLRPEEECVARPVASRTQPRRMSVNATPRPAGSTGSGHSMGGCERPLHHPCTVPPSRRMDRGRKSGADDGARSAQRTQLYLLMIASCSMIICSAISLYRPHSLSTNFHLVPDTTHSATNTSLAHMASPAPADEELAEPAHTTTKTPPRQPLDRTGRIVQALQQHYWAGCGSTLRAVDQGMIGQMEASDEFVGVLLGSEMWNSLSLMEVDDRFRFYADPPADAALPPVPMTVLSYGKRLEQGRALLGRIGALRTDTVSYPSVQAAFDDRPFLARHLFRNADAMSWANFSVEFSDKNGGYLLSTLNQWVVFQRLANGTYTDEILVIEDDMFLVPDFHRKFTALRSQLATVPWDVVFLGTCFGIRSYTPVTANLYVTDRSRCFNAVLLKACAAVKVLNRGAVVDSFAAVDHLFNTYIPELDLKAYYAYPPLAYEQSKNSIQYPC